MQSLMIFLLCYNIACFSLVIFNLWSLLWLLFPTFSAFLWEVNQNNHSEEKKKNYLVKEDVSFLHSTTKELPEGSLLPFLIHVSWTE